VQVSCIVIELRIKNELCLLQVVMASSPTMDRIMLSRAMDSKVTGMVAVMPTGIRSSIITRHMAQEHRDGDR